MKKNGWTNWKAKKIVKKSIALKPYPDAIATNPDGERIIVLIERKFKTAKVYGSEIMAYMKLIQSGEFDRIQYFVPPKTSRRIDRLINVDCLKQGPGSRIVISEYA